MNKYTHKKGASVLIIAFSIVTLMAMASLTIDLAVITNAQHELQKATETAALVGASKIEPHKVTSGTITETLIDTSSLEDEIIKIFDYSLDKIVAHKSNTDDYIKVNINADSKAVSVETIALAKTYFLAVIGIHYIEIKSVASAMSAPFYLTKSLPSGGSSVLTTSKYDTDIRLPLGDAINVSGSTAGENVVLDNLYGTPDNKSVSLGAGGYITIKLPFPLKNSNGADLFVNEIGNIEGYFLFAGSDLNPDKPYINESNQGDGIGWINISCTGTPVGNTSDKIGAYNVEVYHLDGTTSYETKFYGSGFFDLGATCNGTNENYDATLSSAKYLKIIDDNAEDGFMADYPDKPVRLLGEHESATPGADIDAVAVLHKSRLIRTAEFNEDTDSDGLINVLEVLLGTNINNSDSDGDLINDNLEYTGWFYNSGTAESIVNNATTAPNFTSPINNDSSINDYIIRKINL